jgi:hypothetical protein
MFVEIINVLGVLMSFSQKEAVYAAVKAYLDDKSIQHDDGQLVSLDKDGRKTVIEMIATAAMNGNMAFSAEAKAKYDTIEKVREYGNGLLSNWLRKDKRLNGGSTYVAKNPGSRAGQGDETVKALRALKTQLSEKSQIEAVDSELTKRLDFLRAGKKKQVTIDINLLPESVRNLFKA